MSLHTLARQGLERFLQSLPPRYRDDKLPYALLFVALITVVLLAYAFAETALLPRSLYLSMTLLILALSALVIRGLSLSLAVHLGTAAGAALLTVMTLLDGGVGSPRMPWLLILPVTPMYVVGRRAGLGWFAVVLLLQVGIGVCAYRGWWLNPQATVSLFEMLTSMPCWPSC